MPGDPFPNDCTAAAHVNAISQECLGEWVAIKVNVAGRLQAGGALLLVRSQAISRFLHD